MATVEFTVELRRALGSGAAVALNGEAEFNGILRLLGPLTEGQFQKQFGFEWKDLKSVLDATDPDSSA